jgi:hypothetical protein
MKAQQVAFMAQGFDVKLVFTRNPVFYLIANILMLISKRIDAFPSPSSELSACFQETGFCWKSGSLSRLLDSLKCIGRSSYVVEFLV